MYVQLLGRMAKTSFIKKMGTIKALLKTAMFSTFRNLTLREDTMQ